MKSSNLYCIAVPDLLQSDFLQLLTILHGQNLLVKSGVVKSWVTKDHAVCAFTARRFANLRDMHI